MNNYGRRTGPEEVIGVILGAVLILIILAFIFMGSFTEVVPVEKVGLTYEGGPIEGKGKYIKTIEPGSGRVITGMLNPTYQYPVTKRSYIISKSKNEGDVKGSDSVIAPSSDGITMTYQIALYFTLNRDNLREFHEEVGRKFDAHEKDGWNKMLADVFRQQIESALQKETRTHEATAIFSDRDTLDAIEKNIRTTLKDRINNTLGGDYFCGPAADSCDEFGFVIKKVELPEDVLKSIEGNRTSEIEVKTKQNEIQQKKAEAAAIRELQVVLEDCGQVCVLNKAVETGAIDFWVLPSDTSVIRGGNSGQ